MRMDSAISTLVGEELEGYDNLEQEGDSSSSSSSSSSSRSGATNTNFTSMHLEQQEGEQRWVVGPAQQDSPPPGPPPPRRSLTIMMNACTCFNLCIAMVIYGLFVQCVFFVGLILFGGPALICHATVGSEKEKKLMHNYLENGMRVDGRVEIQWRTLETTSSDTQAWVDKVIVSYDGPDGNRYKMKLVPLGEKEKASIVVTPKRCKDIIPIILLEEIPTSGVPASCIDPDSSLSIYGKIALFIGGCVLSSYWYVILWSYAGASLRDIIIGGVVANMFLTAITFYIKERRNHPMLSFSQRVEEGDVIAFEDTGLNNPLNEIDQFLRKSCDAAVTAYCCCCRSLGEEKERL